MFLSLPVVFFSFFFFLEGTCKYFVIFLASTVGGLVAGLQQVLVIQRTTCKNKNGSGNLCHLLSSKKLFLHVQLFAHDIKDQLHCLLSQSEQTDIKYCCDYSFTP